MEKKDETIPLSAKKEREREQTSVFLGYCGRPYTPQNIKDLPSWVDPDEHVGHGDELEVGLLGVGEEDLRLPDGLDQVWVCQVQWALDVWVREAGVRPLLAQVGVRHVVLYKHKACMTRNANRMNLERERDVSEFFVCPLCFFSTSQKLRKLHCFGILYGLACLVGYLHGEKPNTILLSPPQLANDASSIAKQTMKRAGVGKAEGRAYLLWPRAE